MNLPDCARENVARRMWSTSISELHKLSDNLFASESLTTLQVLRQIVF